MTFETLTAEAIHAVDYAFHLGMTEAQVCALSSAMYAFVRDNPDFINEILKGEKV